MIFQQKRRKWISLLVAPVFGTISIGLSDNPAQAQSGCDPCAPMRQTTPCDPSDMRYSDGDYYRAPDRNVYQSAPVTPAPQQTLPNTTDSTAPQVDPAPEPPVMPELDDFSPPATNVNLSSGLATNFGSGGAGSLAFSDSFVTPGYIESAKIQTRVRLRYDNMTGANKPSRGQFLYPSLGAFGGDGPPAGGIGGGGGGGGGGGIGIGGLDAAEVDLEQVSTYIELALRERFSLFIDVPVRWIGPINFGGQDGFTDGTQRGAGDISAGFRWGLIDSPQEHLTFQLRTTLPTGEPLRALGTGNTTIDIGLLYDEQLTSKLWFFSEINDWQTLDAVTLDPATISNPNLASQDANILRGGVGLGYELYRCGSRCQPKKLTLLTEIVTWTVLDGVTTSLDPNDNTVEDATGDTIVNGKYGVRYTQDQNSIYVGYGHNWTNDRWYSDLFRLEWQRTF